MTRIVGADVVLLHGCPQSCMPNPFEGLLEAYEDMVEVMLVLKIFLTEGSSSKRIAIVYFRVVYILAVSLCADARARVHARVCTCCLLYTSPSPRDCIVSRMPSSA